MTDWVAWHEAYESPDSSLSRRVAVVQRRLGEVLGALGPGTTVLSLCAGDGRDVIEVCQRGSAGMVARAVLVEFDAVLAERAAAAASDLAMVEVRRADAADTTVYADVTPTDVLLLCGILGNVDPGSVAEIVRRSGALVREGGYVLWTRGGGEPDRRGEVRALFERHGFEEVAFDGEPERFGVGVGRLRRRPLALRDEEELFRFVR